MASARCDWVDPDVGLRALLPLVGEVGGGSRRAFPFGWAWTISNVRATPPPSRPRKGGGGEARLRSTRQQPALAHPPPLVGAGWGGGVALTSMVGEGGLEKLTIQDRATPLLGPPPQGVRMRQKRRVGKPRPSSRQSRPSAEDRKLPAAGRARFPPGPRPAADKAGHGRLRRPRPPARFARPADSRAGLRDAPRPPDSHPG